MKPQVAIEAREISFAYENGPALIDVSLRAGAGELVALLGPNGSGKTTLLRILLGFLRPARGDVRLYDRPIEDYEAKERAKTIAYVSQQPASSFPLKVSELVSLGRYPHAARFRLAGADSLAVDKALEETDCKHLKDRAFSTLSGGEKQKILIARALAQSAQILLLDEPTLHLDLYYQLQILAALRKLCREREMTVITVLHDVNLASLFADKALMLGGGRARAFGPAHDVITETNIKDIMGVDMKRTDDAQTGLRYFIPSRPFGSSRGSV